MRLIRFRVESFDKESSFRSSLSLAQTGNLLQVEDFNQKAKLLLLPQCCVISDLHL
jgi:hypothetical protein